MRLQSDTQWVSLTRQPFEGQVLASPPVCVLLHPLRHQSHFSLHSLLLSLPLLQPIQEAQTAKSLLLLHSASSAA